MARKYTRTGKEALEERKASERETEKRRGVTKRGGVYGGTSLGFERFVRRHGCFRGLGRGCFQTWGRSNRSDMEVHKKGKADREQGHAQYHKKRATKSIIKKEMPCVMS